MARPKALTPSLKTEICDRIMDGETIRQIAADPRMPAASTIYLALANDDGFSEQYARAREIQLQQMEDELLAIADNTLGPDAQDRKLMIDTRKWLMAKRLPKKYGERIQQEIDVSNELVRGVVNMRSSQEAKA